MRNLILSIALSLAPAFALAQDQQPTPPAQQIPGAELFGHWTSSVRQIVRGGEIALEINFSEDRIEFHAVCNFERNREIRAVSASHVQYRNHYFRILNSSRSRISEGPFFCESSIQPNLVDFEKERDGVYRLYFQGQRQPIYIFKAE